jgi:D-cysteine desulfhydrase
MTVALFEAYPALSEKLPRVVLCDLPTPIAKLAKMGDAIGVPALYVKRDDISAAAFGGNKVRALEFLLGDALKNNAKGVFVAGLAGTSMALASAIYAKQQNLDLAVLLISQTATEEAKRNLLIFHRLGAGIHDVASVPTLLLQMGGRMLGGLLKHGKPAKMLNPTGPIGMTGYVNAAFELRQQVAQGILPEPDRLYIAMGLLGTATGLLLGLRAAGLKTKVVAVHHPHDEAGVAKTKVKMVNLLHKVNRFLRARDNTFPLVEVQPNEIEIRCDAPGQQANTLLSQGLPLMEQVHELEDLTLDATWTAGTWVAMQRDIESENLHDKALLFWHTYNSRPPYVNTDNIDYHQLPAAFHRYFEEQPQLVNRPLWAKD